MITVEVLDRLISNLVNSSRSYYLDENLSCAFLTDLWQHIVTYIDIGRMLNCGLVVAMFSPDSNMHQPHLVVINLVDKSCISYYIVNPKSLFISEHTKSCGNALVLAILKYIRVFDAPFLIDSPNHFISVCGKLNYIILYGLICDIFEGRPFTTLNIDDLSRQIIISKLLPDKPTVNNKIGIDNTIRDKLFNTIENRRAFVKALISENLNSDPNKWMSLITDSVALNKPIKTANKPYLGNKIKGTIDDTGKWEVRQSYAVDRRTTIRKILNNDDVNQWPPVNDIIKHFTREIPNTTDWSFEPCIRSGDIDIYTGEITSIEILKVIKKTNKSSPGEDGISYTDLKLLDPDCDLLAIFFNSILTTGIIPETWKRFNTILIPKPGKTGEYGDISNSLIYIL